MDMHLKQMRFVHHKNTFYKKFHTHDLWELAYYVNGYGTVSREDVKYEYKKSVIHIVKKGVLHDEKNDAESRIILLYFDMSDEFLEQGIYKDNNGKILELLRNLRFEMQENLLYKQEMTDSLLMQILLILKRKQFPQITENKNFNHIVRYIDENFQSQIDVKTIAKKAFYSYDRFRHVFKEHTGCAPNEYINNKRIELAKFLIDIDPSISATTLVSECGFKSLSQFSNAFRSKMKVSPTEYKQKRNC